MQINRPLVAGYQIPPSPYEPVNGPRPIRAFIVGIIPQHPEPFGQFAHHGIGHEPHLFIPSSPVLNRLLSTMEALLLVKLLGQGHGILTIYVVFYYKKNYRFQSSSLRIEVTARSPEYPIEKLTGVYFARLVAFIQD
jgi:hypothetical protein